VGASGRMPYRERERARRGERVGMIQADATRARDPQPGRQADVGLANLGCVVNESAFASSASCCYAGYRISLGQP